MNNKHIDDRKFLAWLTFALILASLWIFKSYLHYLLVAATLGLATSHLYMALITLLTKLGKKGLVYKNREIIVAVVLCALFLLMLFGPLLYFVSVTYEQANNLDLDQIRQTLTEMVDKTIVFLDKIPFVHEPLARLNKEGLSFIKGPAIEALMNGAKGVVVGAGGLLGQVVWILIFYFLFNTYGRQVLRFLADLAPMSYEHEEYLYRECAGTVAVVFYGTMFNMAAQGIAFGLLMV